MQMKLLSQDHSTRIKQYKTESVYYLRGGVSQALRATDYKDPPKIIVNTTNRNS